MRASGVWRTAVLSAAALVAMSSGGLRGAGDVLAQTQGTPQQTMPGGIPPLDQPAMPGGGMNLPDGGARARMEAARMRSLNDDRRKRLEADCDKLVELTNELKTDVDKTDKDELSLVVIRKAAEIEKLAHDVQNKMKN